MRRFCAPYLRPWTTVFLCSGVLLTGLLGLACSEVELTPLACADTSGGADVQDVTPDGVDDTGTEIAKPDGGGIGQAVAGGPGSACASNADCDNMGAATGLCMTTALLGIAVHNAGGAVVTNGMCVAYDLSGQGAACDPTGDPEAVCGPGGYCFDAATLFGGEAGKETLCGHPCGIDAHCRADEDYGCYYTGKVIEVRVCLPNDLIDNVIPCGNDKCEPIELEDAQTCPRDCE